MTFKHTSLKEFALLFSARADRLAWFLGAGSSAASGIPTGYDMIVDFKTRIFCSETSLARREVDPADPLWSERIDEFLTARDDFPVLGSPEEYSFYFEHTYPDPADRRRYIEGAIRRGSPTFGHRVLAALAVSKRAPVLFTTNFDPLIEESCTEVDALLPAGDRARINVADLSRVDVASRCLRDHAWPLLTKLHGDYQSERLKNIGPELVSQDQSLRDVLIGVCQQFGLVVAGYSGRDASIMEALSAALAAEAPYPAGLYWVTKSQSPLLPAVVRLLEAAAAKGVDTHVVECENFDELLGGIERQLDFADSLDAHVRAARPAARVVPVSLPTNVASQFPLLRTSALPLLSIPLAARRINLENPGTTRELRQALKAADQHRGTAVAAIGRGCAAFGSDEQLLTGLARFGPSLAGEVPLDPLADSWALGLLYDSLVHALARGRPMRALPRARGHLLILSPPRGDHDDLARHDRQALTKMRNAYDANLTGTVAGLGRPYAEALEIRIEPWLDRWWCVLDPFTFVELPRSEDVGMDEVRRSVTVAADWRRERWARRYNSRWNHIIDGWAHLLAPERLTRVVMGPGPGAPGIAAEFEVHQATAWSRPAQRPETSWAGTRS